MKCTHVLRIGDGEAAERGEAMASIFRSNPTYQAGLGACFLPISASVEQHSASSSLLLLSSSLFRIYIYYRILNNFLSQ